MPKPKIDYTQKLPNLSKFLYEIHKEQYGHKPHHMRAYNTVLQIRNQLSVKKIAFAMQRNLPIEVSVILANGEIVKTWAYIQSMHTSINTQTKYVSCMANGDYFAITFQVAPHGQSMNRVAYVR